MQTATINVRYVNPPKGRGPASVKDDKGTYWKFWTKDLSIDNFKPDTTYNVQYSVEQYEGKDQYYIQAVLGGSPKAAVTTITNSNGQAPTPRYAPTDDKTAERIFVCGGLNAAISAGKCELEASDLIATVEALRSTYQATFGKA